MHAVNSLNKRKHLLHIRSASLSTRRIHLVHLARIQLNFQNPNSARNQRFVVSSWLLRTEAPPSAPALQHLQLHYQSLQPTDPVAPCAGARCTLQASTMPPAAALASSTATRTCRPLHLAPRRAPIAAAVPAMRHVRTALHLLSPVPSSGAPAACLGFCP
jgi:hypothetical protein